MRAGIGGSASRTGDYGTGGTGETGGGASRTGNYGTSGTGETGGTGGGARRKGSNKGNLRCSYSVLIV